MNMKNASIKFLAAILFSAIAIVPLRAQTNAPAENGTNSPVAVTNSAPASNSIAMTETKAQKPSSESSPVRIGNTGVHNGDIHISLAPFITFIVIVAIFSYSNHRRNKMMHETMRAMIEKGVPITPELLAHLQDRPSGFSNQLGRSRQRHLLPGLIMTGIGAALLITNLGRNSGDGKIGCMALFIGVAFLIVWFVERRDKNGDQPPKP